LFESLSEKLGGILDRLTKRGALSAADVDAALREVRRALLEADVALDVARVFVDKVREHAVGVDVVKSVTPGQMVVKIVHDQLIETLGASGQGIDLNAPAPVAIMMVGLQGSGKTTTTAKLAKRLRERANRKTLMASLDVRRPAAMEQLAVLGRDVGIDTLPVVQGQAPAQIARRALEAGRLGGYDVVLLDTAGRTTLDEAMMAEAAEVKRAANPHEVLLVADALTGQDAVNLARSFDERVGLTGIVLTRIDGDGRGGAALSMRAVTGKPIKLIGTGEKMDALEDFDPARIAGRILGMGDIVALVEKAAANIDAEKAMRSAERMRKGAFDLNDLRDQLDQMSKMGGIGGLMGMLPGVAKMKNQIAAANLDDGLLKRQKAMIDSMTPKERPQPGPAEEQPQEAHRRRLRHQGRRAQQAFENAPRHGRHDESHGQRRQARADGRPRQYARHGRPGRRARSRWRKWRRTCPQRRRMPPGMPKLPANFPGMPSGIPGWEA
jgi:signal recognition particle subunit SRP54